MLVLTAVVEPNHAVCSAKNNTLAVRAYAVDAASAGAIWDENQEFATHGADKDITVGCRHDQLHRILRPSVASIFLGDLIAPVRQQLRVHFIIAFEIRCDLDVLVGVGARNNASEVLTDLLQRDLEGQWVDMWIDDIERNIQ